MAPPPPAITRAVKPPVSRRSPCGRDPPDRCPANAVGAGDSCASPETARNTSESLLQCAPRACGHPHRSVTSSPSLRRAPCWASASILVGGRSAHLLYQMPWRSYRPRDLLKRTTWLTVRVLLTRRVRLASPWGGKAEIEIAQLRQPDVAFHEEEIALPPASCHTRALRITQEWQRPSSLDSTRGSDLAWPYRHAFAVHLFDFGTSAELVRMTHPSCRDSSTVGMSRDPRVDFFLRCRPMLLAYSPTPFPSRGFWSLEAISIAQLQCQARTLPWVTRHDNSLVSLSTNRTTFP